MRQRARADNLTTCYRKKQIDVRFSCACPVIDNEFRHNIVKVAVDHRLNTQNPVEPRIERTWNRKDMLQCGLQPRFSHHSHRVVDLTWREASD